jgi:hypothetical protein
MSFNTIDITNGVSVSGSTSPFNTYIKTENAGVYNIQFSAQLDKIDSGNDEIVIWLRKNGINLTDTATTITLSGNNAKNVAAWNWFVNSAANDYYQIIWQSADTNVRLLAEPMDGHPGIPSVIVTANRVDQFLSNTGSFTGSFAGEFIGTASFSSTASYVQTAQTASYVFNAVSSSFASTASFVTASNVYGPYGSNSILSSSYALTASYALTSAGGGGSGAGFPYSGSAIITGSLLISGSGLTVTGSVAFTDGLTLGITFTTASSIANTGLGISILSSIPVSTYTSAFMKYALRNSNNARSGEFMMIWSGTSASFTDVSTTDLGSTSAVIFTGSISGGNVEISTAPGSGWTIKTITTYL